MDADLAALEPVAVEAVLVGVINEHALFGAAHHIVLDARVVRIVEEQAVVAVAVAHVIVQPQSVGIHHDVADVVAADILSATSLSFVYMK